MSRFCNRKAAAIAALVMLAATPGWAEALRLVALGDSLTQGYGLPPEDGFTAQLERWLTSQGRDVQVVNAGVSGDTTAGGRSRVGWALADGADAMLVTLGGNDLLRGIDPAVSRDNLDAILTEAAAQEVPVLLVAMEAPGNYGPEYRASFDAIYPQLAEEHGVALAESFLAPLLDDSQDAALRDYLQEDGLHPNAEGVARIVEGLGPKVLDLIDTATR
ncbi:acyl-CoA thioesterase-1 [Paracoccus alcaliphilus]|uniref:Acyl-CoA thioesterase-1 n=1 Tax=Paracoccus alcaliphilus TaxID=34002 RepID=A0A1H8F452_9RHOB|nr:arylesterase [Paracoccus alcaliphilus]WCR20397.1 arylesterase [Paracoccus alcaliphilus]SEN25788.1 acyl-CoA thioesterase-1 [Paracoccus alcaliphilus]